jgi:amino acid permease
VSLCVFRAPLQHQKLFDEVISEYRERGEKLKGSGSSKTFYCILNFLLKMLMILQMALESYDLDGETVVATVSPRV